jgi:proteic killer suppression protein
VIRSYRDDATRRLAERIRVPQFQAVEKPARKALQWLQLATELRDLAHPGLHLEKLKGQRAGQYSIRVNKQYRVCFRWKDGAAYNVELTDYH